MDPTFAGVWDVVLLSLAAAAAAVLAPALPFFGVPLAALALGWLSFRHGIAAGVGAALFAIAAGTLGGALLGFAPSSSAVFVGPALLIAGPGAAWALRRSSATGVIAAVTLAMTAAFMLSPLSAQFLAGSTSLLRAYGDAFVKGAAQQPGTDVTALKQGFAAAVTQMVAAWPSVVFKVMGLCALISVPLVSRAGRAAGVEVQRLPQLAELDLSFHWVWLAIAGLLLLAGAAYLRQQSGAVWATGMNLLLIVEPPLFFQGLGDFSALYRRVGLGRFGRGIGYTVLAMSELIVPSVSVLGAVDLFFNLRKLPRGEHGNGRPPA